MRIKFGIKTLIAVACVHVFVIGFVLSAAYQLMNQRNDAAFAVGCGALLVQLLTTIAVLPWYRRTACRIAEEFVKRSSGMLLVLVCLPLAGCGCERVNPGYVGIKINMAGSSRGVDDVPIVTGWAFYNPLTETVLEYPTFVQTAQWAGENEQVTFNSKEGLLISGDISVSYQLQHAKVPAFYVKFRSDDLTTFTHGYLRNVARDQFNEVAGTYAIEDLYGPKKEQFIRAVRDRINSELKSIGVVVEQFGFVGAPRPPQAVIDAINAKIAATQQAMQRENELRTAEAEARKRVAMAKGEADSRVAAATGQAQANMLIADGTAKAKVIIAKGDAEANRTLAASLSPELLSWRDRDNAQAAIQKWNGQRPQVEGSGAGLLLQVGAK